MRRLREQFCSSEASEYQSALLCCTNQSFNAGPYVFHTLALGANKNIFIICDSLLHSLSRFVPSLVQLCEAFTFCVFRDVHFLEPARSVSCGQVSLAFNNNDEMKASYVGTSDQCNLSRTHVDSCQGSGVTFGL